MHTGKVTVKIYTRQNLNVWKCKHVLMNSRNAVQTHLQQLTEQDLPVHSYFHNKQIL